MANLSYGTGNSSYYDLARQQRVFCAYATVTAPVIFSTAAGTGGPLLWNGSATTRKVNAVLLSVGFGIATASTVAASLGITGNSGQVAAPSATTTIDGVANTNIGGPAPACSTFRIGTVTNAGNFFQPLCAVGTGAVTVDNIDMAWADIGGSIIVPPGSWMAVAASATLTTAVMHIGMLWAEIPI